MAENRVTSVAVESLHSGSSTTRVTSEGIEVLHSGATTNARVSSVAIEVLRTIGAGGPDLSADIADDGGLTVAGTPVESFDAGAFDIVDDGGLTVTASIALNPDASFSDDTGLAVFGPRSIAIISSAAISDDAGLSVTANVTVFPPPVQTVVIIST